MAVREVRERLRRVARMVALACALIGPAPGMAQTAPPQVSQDELDKAKLAAAFTEALMPLDLARRALGGKGGDWLSDRVATADILMIGETHGTGSIAEVAGFLVDALPRDRELAYAAEMGPHGAAALEPLLRGPEAALDSHMADPRRANSVAFLFLREEAAFARKVLARAAPGKSALWGLDQEFVASAPILLDTLARLARTPAQKAALDEAQPVFAPFMAIASVPDSAYDRLATSFKDGPDLARQLIAEMRFSTRVYQMQERAGNQSNRLREDYMKRNFLAHWRERGGKPPRVVMKFGAYHLVAGISPSSTPALGSFIDSLALMEGKTRFSVLILCGPDGEQISFQGQLSSCAKDFAETGGPFGPHLFADGATLIDTAPLRLIPGTMRRQGFDEDVRGYIQSYDAIIVLRAANAARPYAPAPASWFGSP